MVSGFIYSGWWAVDGASLAGPVSMRKPILFGLSTGVTLLSLTWVINRLTSHRGDDALFSSLGAALVVEVALIDLQQFRGVPSHFNHQTPFDSVVTNLMGILILWATVLIVLLTFRAFRQSNLQPDECIVMRAGLVYLALACGLGIAITVIGENQLAAGAAPETFGSAGVMKFPHGIPLHAIQILFVQAWVLRAVGAPPEDQVRSLWASAAAIGFATLYGVVQTSLGAPRFPPQGAAWTFAALTVLAGLLAMFFGRPRRSDAARVAYGG